MQKKIVLFIIFALVLAVGGVFWWWQSGEELRELNKNLPEGVRVIEREGRQVIVNEKDGYEIKVPEEWGGFGTVEYLGEEKGKFIIGAKETKDWIAINTFEKKEETDLKAWIMDYQNQTMRFNPTIFGEERIGNHNVIEVRSDDPIIGTAFIYYFQKNSQIYEIYTDYSEKSIKDVILNGNF